jgi:hypothetical protein
VNRFPYAHPAAALWYHDRAIGITRLNIDAGLAGFYRTALPNKAIGKPESRSC